MANLDMTAMSAALKEYYHGQKVTDLVYKKNPLLAMLKKDTKAGGKVIPVPLQYAPSQGRSAAFATAQANQTAVKLSEFMLTRVSDYSIATIDNQTMEASSSDVEAFISASKLFIDGAWKTITLSLAKGVFNTKAGYIGVISDETSGVVTLTNPGDIVNFEVGQSLEAYTTLTAGVLSVKDGSTAYVVGIDRSAGKFSVSTTQGGSVGTPTWTDASYIVVEGDVNAKMSGVSAWIPPYAATRIATTDNFFGVNRSADVDRLAGVAFDGSALSIEEALIDGSNRAAELGGSPSKCFMNYRSYSALVKALGSKVQYVDLESDAGIGFRGVRINGDDGEIDVIPDRNCPAATGLLLDLDTWCLRSVGEAPHIVTYGKEGLEMLRVSNADAAEVRLAYYAQLECNAPGWNCNIKLGA